MSSNSTSSPVLKKSNKRTLSYAVEDFFDNKVAKLERPLGDEEVKYDDNLIYSAILKGTDSGESSDWRIEQSILADTSTLYHDEEVKTCMANYEAKVQEYKKCKDELRPLKEALLARMADKLGDLYKESYRKKWIQVVECNKQLQLLLVLYPEERSTIERDWDAFVKKHGAP